MVGTLGYTISGGVGRCLFNLFRRRFLSWVLKDGWGGRLAKWVGEEEYRL